MTAADKPKARRGFAAMSEEKRREIASRGGNASQASGRAHRFDRESARAAGRASHAKRAAKRAELENEEPKP